jgi:PIN domain nuclease of toxin-antitoxin system
LSAHLLDTTVVLLALTEPGELTDRVREAILAGPNVLSAVVYWEVMLKSMKGNLRIGDPRVWWHDALEQLAATSLPIRAEHIAGVYDLSPIHHDPFDRVLIAQATVEAMVLVTADAAISGYASERLRVLH